MTKYDLIEALVHDSRLPRSSAIKAVEGTIKALSNAIVAREDITLRGFATIKVIDIPAKQWTNLNTGLQETIPPSRKIKFTPSVELKNKIKNGKLD